MVGGETAAHPGFPNPLGRSAKACLACLRLCWRASLVPGAARQDLVLDEVSLKNKKVDLGALSRDHKGAMGKSEELVWAWQHFQTPRSHSCLWHPLRMVPPSWCRAQEPGGRAFLGSAA